MSTKKVKIAEDLVNQRHPLSRIHLAKALPIFKYLPSWLLQKDREQEDAFTEKDDDVYEMAPSEVVLQ